MTKVSNRLEYLPYIFFFTLVFFLATSAYAGSSKTSLPENEHQTTAEKDFRMVLQTRYNNMPTEEQLGVIGFDQIRLLTSWFFFFPDDPKPENLTDEIREKIILSTERYLEDNQEVVLDIEHWPYGMNATLEERAETVSKMVEIMDIMHSVRPSLKFGYYSVPIRSYWDVYENCAWNDSRHELCMERQNAWHTANDQLKPLIERASFMLPSLYTFYDNIPGWMNYAQANLQEAKRLREDMGLEIPIYIYLWPRYHDSSDMAFQLIEPHYWRMQLELMHTEGADGIIIWDNSPHQDFIDIARNDPWFAETITFMMLHDLAYPDAAPPPPKPVETNKQAQSASRVDIVR